MNPRPTAPDDPVVSVVMVTHGAWRWTSRALAALAAHTELAYEVIVVDNASPDETPARLAEIDGTRIVLNAENRGFGPGCNQGAALARGTYVLFLNTDAMVHPGWLEPMVQTLATTPWVGAVVPRYLHEDGRLQEAGALLAQDGTVLTYGDGDEPDRLRYRFRRVIDFGGAACMLVRRAEFTALDGFDPVYAPAYYEDVDFCFRLARTGRVTMYEPRSLVTHIRHASGGLEQATQLSDTNRATFVDRWRPRLRGRPASLVGSGGRARLAARDALALERVLVLDPASVEPDGGGAAAVVAALAGERPHMRLAWLTGALGDERFDPRPWLDRGVELVDEPLETWLAERPLHFDAVIAGETLPETLRDLVGATQPQARVIVAPLGAGAVPADLLAAAGIAAPHVRVPAPLAGSSGGTPGT
jgi:GT2 family glycosyltransferase